jgi:hypothetical protein
MVFGNDLRRSHRFRASVLARDLSGLDDFMGEIAMNDLEAYYEAAEQEEEQEEERQKQQNEHQREQRHPHGIASVPQTQMHKVKMNDSVYMSYAEESSSDHPIPLTRPQQDRQRKGIEPVGALESIFRQSPGSVTRRGGSMSDSLTTPSRDDTNKTTPQTSSSRTNNLEHEGCRESQVGDHHHQQHHHHDDSSNGPDHHENRRSSMKKEEERSNNRKSHHSSDRYEELNDAARHANVEHHPIVERKAITHLGTVSHRSPRLELYSASVSPRRVSRKTMAQVVHHASAASPFPRSPQVVHRRRVESTPSPKRGRIHRRSTTSSIPVAKEKEGEKEEEEEATRRRASSSSCRRHRSSSSRRPSPSPTDYADVSVALTKEEEKERRRRSPGAARSRSRSSSATPTETHKESEAPSREASSVSESLPTDNNSNLLVNPAEAESLPPPPPPLLSPRQRRSSSRKHHTHRQGELHPEEMSPSHRRSRSASDRKSRSRSKAGTPDANQDEEDSASFGADDSEVLMITPDIVAVPPPPPQLSLLSPKGGERRRTRSRDNNTHDAARRGEDTRGYRQQGSSGAGRSRVRSSSVTRSEVHEEGERPGGNGIAIERDSGDKVDSLLSPPSESLPPLSQITTTSREQRIRSRPNGHWASRREESRGARSKSASRREESRGAHSKSSSRREESRRVRSSSEIRRREDDDAIGVPPVALDPLHSNSEVDKERNLASHFQHPPRNDRGQHRRSLGTMSVPDSRTRSRSNSVSREDGNSYRSAGRSTMASSIVSDNQEPAESERHASRSGDRKSRGRSPAFGIEAKVETRSRSIGKLRLGEDDRSLRGSSRSSHRRSLPDSEHSELQVSRRSSASENSSKRGQSGNNNGVHQHQHSRDNVVHKASRFIQRMATASHHGGQLEANLAQLNSPPTRKPHRDDEYSHSRSKSTERGNDSESGVLSTNMDERNTLSGEFVTENPLLSPRSTRRRDRRSARAGPSENDTTVTSERKHRGHRSTRDASPNQANDDGSHPTEGDAARSSRRRGQSSSRTHRHARSKSGGPSEQNEGSCDVDGQNSSIITPSVCESIQNSGHSDSLRGSQDPVTSTHLHDDRSRSPSQRRQSRRSFAKAAFAMSLSPPLGRKSMTWSLATPTKGSGIGITRRSSHAAKSASYENLEKNEEVSLHLTPDFLEYKRRSSSVTTTSTLPFSDSVLSLDHEDQ